MGIGVRLLCCLEGKPWPTVKWLKNGRELSKSDYNMSAKDGVVTLDILVCKIEDAGTYTCIATNEHGTTETSCALIVEPKRGVSPSPRAGSPAITRIGTPTPSSGGLTHVPTPMERYYSSGGASTVLREARGASVFSQRSNIGTTTQRKESISSLYDRTGSVERYHYPSSTYNRYQTQNSYTSSRYDTSSGKYSSSTSSNLNQQFRASSVSNNASSLRAESPHRIHSPTLHSYSSSRPSALPSSSYTPSSHRAYTTSKLLSSSPSSSVSIHSSLSTDQESRRTKPIAKLDGKPNYCYY